MHESFLKDIALVLGVAALISILSHKLRLPSVLGYLIAGLIIGPYIPIPLFADPHRVEVLSEFGVILVMFSIGLEFNLKKFFRVLPTSGVTAALEISFMFISGVSLGYLFGWSQSQSIFLGGALSISSTMIVSKIFEEKNPSPSTREHVLGILIIQDFVAILLLTLLGAYSISKDLNIESLAPTLSKLFFTLLVITVAGLFIVPRYIRYAVSLKNSEVLIISSTGICFTLALFVQNLGYSVALGAFLSGLLISESGTSLQVEKISKPLKDVFVAIFFVSIGMTIDPFSAFKALPYSITIALLVITFQFSIVSMGSVLSGGGINKSILSALSLGQIGEFSFIIAAIGTSAGMVSNEFQAIIVTVAIITSLASPFLWRNSDAIANKVSQLIPSKLRVTFGLYEAWFQRMKEYPTDLGTFFGIPKKVLLVLFLDSLLLISIPSFSLQFFPNLLENLGVIKGTYLSYVITFIFIALALSPVIYGFSKLSSLVIITLSKALFPLAIRESQTQSTAESFFRMSVWTVLCLTVSFPMLALLRPFMNVYIFSITIVVTFLILIFRLWTTAGKFSFDTEGGGERIFSTLKRQTFNSPQNILKTPEIPGLDKLESIQVKNQKIFGKNLLELNIRNLTGATVVSISRRDQTIMFPNHTELISQGDVLQIWGSPEAKGKCRELLN